MKKNLSIITATGLLWLTWACGNSNTAPARPTGNTGSMSNILSQKALGFYQTDIDSVFIYADSARKQAESSGDSTALAVAATHLCEFHRRNGNFDKAIASGLQALRLFRSADSSQAEAGTLLQIAVVYKEMGGEKKTIRFLQQGLEQCAAAQAIYERLKDTAGLINTCSAKGIIYRDLSKVKGRQHLFDTAYRLYNTALQLQTLSGAGAEHLGKLYNNISQVYIEHFKNYPKGLEYLGKALAFNYERNNLMSLTYNYGNLTSVWLKQGQPDSALRYARQALDLSSRNHMPHRLVNAYNSMYLVWLAKKRPDSALVYLKKHYDTYDSLTNLSKTGQISEMQARFETSEKEASIIALNTVNKNKSKSITWLSLGIAAVGILCGLAWWLYRRSRRQQIQIAAQSKKMELLMKELHHRVKNNLQIVSSLLSLQSYRIKDEKALEAIQESRLRVQAMSLIHQRLYTTNDVTAINIKAYLTDLAEQIVSGFGYDKDSFTLHIETEQELLDVDKALPLGLIVNEVATNALKYAYQSLTGQPQLTIGLRNNGDNLVLNISDNGPGMDMNRWNGSNASFGKQLITALAKQIRARQQIDTGSGTSFTFTIPLAA